MLHIWKELFLCIWLGIIQRLVCYVSPGDKYKYTHMLSNGCTHPWVLPMAIQMDPSWFFSNFFPRYYLNVAWQTFHWTPLREKRARFNVISNGLWKVIYPWTSETPSVVQMSPLTLGGSAPFQVFSYRIVDFQCGNTDIVFVFRAGLF